MFKNKRYITKGVDTQIPIWLTLYLWNKVDTMCKRLGEQTDYLQIFNITTNNKDLLIEHTQEQPPVKDSTKLKYLGKPINEKIYVIDSEEYSTMLLAEEY